MTEATDINLLPLPSPQVPFIDCDPSMTDIRRLVRWYEQGATEYARANVAPLQAEVEALRAEVERVTCELMDALTHADNLEEALREAYGQVRELCACYCHAYPEESFARYEALLREQEEV